MNDTYRHLAEALKNRREAGFTRDDDAKATARVIDAAIELVKMARLMGTNLRASTNALAHALCDYQGEHDFGNVEAIDDHDGHGRHQVIRSCVRCKNEVVVWEPCNCEPDPDLVRKGILSDHFRCLRD